MSDIHPIVAVTGSSGSDASVVTTAFQHMLRREGAKLAVVDGNGFHRYDRAEFRDAVRREAEKGRGISHFGPEANLFDRLDALLRTYAASGGGEHRRYVHCADEAERLEQTPGTFTAWDPVPEDTDLLCYEGLHGCHQDDDVDIAQYMDLKIGMVPVINLEWMRKIDRDTGERGYTSDAVAKTILRRMQDYVRYIVPQFSRTDINFQPVPTVDSSDPFAEQEPVTLEQCVIVVRFRNPLDFGVDFTSLLSRIRGSFMSRRNTIVLPGSELVFAMELILQPRVHQLLELSQRARAA